MREPPELPSRKNRKLAVIFNCGVPGAGQLYLGQVVFGLALLIPFLASFVGVIFLMWNGFSAYLRLAGSEDIFEPGRLESVGEAFHFPWLLGCLGAGMALWIISMIAAGRSDEGARD